MAAEARRPWFAPHGRQHGVHELGDGPAFRWLRSASSWTSTARFGLTTDRTPGVRYEGAVSIHCDDAVWGRR